MCNDDACAINRIGYQHVCSSSSLETHSDITERTEAPLKRTHVSAKQLSISITRFASCREYAHTSLEMKKNTEGAVSSLPDSRAGWLVTGPLTPVCFLFPLFLLLLWVAMHHVFGRETLKPSFNAINTPLTDHELFRL